MLCEILSMQLEYAETENLLLYSFHPLSIRIYISSVLSKYFR